VEYLLKTLSNFTKGRENLESLLGSQNVVFNKNGIGYNPGNVTNLKCFQVSLFQQNQVSQLLTVAKRHLMLPAFIV